MRESRSGEALMMTQGKRAVPGAVTRSGSEWVLVLDTCAARSSMALFRGLQIIEERVLEERSASSLLLRVLREVLAAQEICIQNLAAIGVVRGPGSFTGVRVGLALAKGLCEAAGIPLVGVSRLQVLAEAASLTGGFALLEAGRDQFYVHALDQNGKAREWLTSLEEIRSELEGAVVAIASATASGVLETRLHMSEYAGMAELRVIDLTAKDAFGPVLRNLARGETQLAELDANYVRNEETIYAAQRPGKQDAGAGRVA